MKKLTHAFLFILFSLLTSNAQNNTLKINELEYFETQGLNVLVFNNQYTGFFFDEKTAGIELIHHGIRTATGGGVRLRSTPEQWDLIPIVANRKIDKDNNTIEVTLRYDDYHFNSRVVIKGIEKGVIISVYLDEPIPEKLIDNAGFNLEFFPSLYFEKTYLVDGKPNIFPLYPSGPTEVKPSSKKIPQFAGHTTFDDRGKNEFVDPKPLAIGKTIILAPEDPERRIKIHSLYGDIMLFDGRNVAQNGCFVLRSLIPANKTGIVVQWELTANIIENWKRKPVISYSQVGYHPEQKKLAIIELDKNDNQQEYATLYKIDDNGNLTEKFTNKLTLWGNYLRYKYLIFDFSEIKDSGIYLIKYGNQTTTPLLISKHVYENVWHPTLDVWFPVQMDHMFVNEAYRVWHGLPYQDDALQAPVNHQHFDGYRMGPTTDTKYNSLERIPGLGIGGWFDAGDFDIETAHHCNAILSFVETWEHFKINRDQTFIDQQTKYADIHRPDGKPDLLQQIEHGTLQLVAQHKYVGHAFRGIVVPNLHQYHHLGDASTITDNLKYNPELKAGESNGSFSGNLDDRWAFTNKIPWLNYASVAALAAANRALIDYNKELADEALKYAIDAWEKTHNESTDFRNDQMFVRNENAEILAALQLYITTKDKKYIRRFDELIWQALDKSLAFAMPIAIRAVPYLDSQFKNRLKPYVEEYKKWLINLTSNNPFGVPIETRGWGNNYQVINWAITNYYLTKNFPELIDNEYTFKGMNYIFGCHPYSNLSFVSAVGVKSKRIAYGSNRADYSFIAGGVVPGLLILKPDFPENKEEWPFLWGENEYVIDICAAYIFLTNAVNDLLNGNIK